ncbi:hypothetical protein EZV62_027881 [Acer yangbiense]|uniref:Uncharacterized protein n=1 Tax=Acer yangbiense TaxID=1000413 RepID=A0A5C7GQ35_9ROSI|nr:hypothetical protein EZV62_027881 [Acer yangbiense]
MVGTSVNIVKKTKALGGKNGALDGSKIVASSKNVIESSSTTVIFGNNGVLEGSKMVSPSKNVIGKKKGTKDQGDSSEKHTETFRPAMLQQQVPFSSLGNAQKLAPKEKACSSTNVEGQHVQRGGVALFGYSKPLIWDCLFWHLVENYSLAAYMNDDDVINGKIYPSISSIQDITKQLAAAVVKEAIEEDLTEGYREMDDRELKRLKKYIAHVGCKGKFARSAFCLNDTVAAWTGRAPLPPSKKKLKEFNSFELLPHQEGSETSAGRDGSTNMLYNIHALWILEMHQHHFLSLRSLQFALFDGLTAFSIPQKIWRDIKPDNFLMGLGHKANQGKQKLNRDCKICWLQYSSWDCRENYSFISFHDWEASSSLFLLLLYGYDRDIAIMFI